MKNREYINSDGTKSFIMWDYKRPSDVPIGSKLIDMNENAVYVYIGKKWMIENKKD